MKYFLWFIGLLVLVVIGILVYFYTPKLGREASGEPTEEVLVFLTKGTRIGVEFVPVKREVHQSNVIESLVLEALEELVKGPTSAEEKQGLSAPFNPGTKVNYVQIVGDTLTADFNYLFDTPMAGSARVTSLRGMIEATIWQFPLEGIQQIELTVNRGEREAVLEP